MDLQTNFPFDLNELITKPQIRHMYIYTDRGEDVLVKIFI